MPPDLSEFFVVLPKPPTIRSRSSAPSPLREIPVIPHSSALECDLVALPILAQVDAIRLLPPLVAIRAHVLALGAVFKDGTDAFCRGYDLLPDGRP